MFATKWDFLFARVLIGIDRSTGVWSGSEPTPGQQMVCVWTSEQIATAALHIESWELRPIEVRDLVTKIPDGIGIVVDPEHPNGMTASPAYVANLKTMAPAFPVGAPLQIAPWDELEGPVRDAVVHVVRRGDMVQTLHAFMYRVDDSPPIGCVAYTLKSEASDGGAVAAGLTAALEAAVSDIADLGVAAVRAVALSDVPVEVQTALPDTCVIHGRKRSRLWRR